jgi:hypothetical protein
MDPKAVAKARSRLTTARKAIGDCESSNTFDDFSNCWYAFLFAAKGVYTVLQQGAKTSPQSRQWFGGKSRERRTDPLLQYLYQARDDDEYGLSSVLERVQSRTEIGGGGSGFSDKMVFNGVISLEGGPTNLTVTSRDGKPVRFNHSPAHIKLITVHGRDRKSYDPPNEHLGIKLASGLPIPVAKRLWVTSLPW